MNRTICIISFFVFFFNITFVVAKNAQGQSSSAGRQIGQTVGSMAGGAAGNFASGGNIATTTAGSELGRQVGGIAGEQAFIAIDKQVNTSTTESNDSSLEIEGAKSLSLGEDVSGGAGKETPSLLDLK
jgi:hypothetical protein